jgi:hypothetical protein
MSWYLNIHQKMQIYYFVQTNRETMEKKLTKLWSYLIFPNEEFIHSPSFLQLYNKINCIHSSIAHTFFSFRSKHKQKEKWESRLVLKANAIHAHRDFSWGWQSFASKDQPICNQRHTEWSNSILRKIWCLYNKKHAKTKICMLFQSQVLTGSNYIQFTD